MTKLRVGIIGCGGAGKNHAVGYGKTGDIEIVGLADIAVEKAQALADQVGGRSYVSYEEMIHSERPDVVSVCTREHHHVEPTLYALSNGCHVFCEKIMAHELEAGHRMVQTAETNGKKLGVNYNYRFIDSIVSLKEQMVSGALGEIRSAVFQVHVFCHHHAIDLIRFLFGEPEEITSVLCENKEMRNYDWEFAEQMLYIPSINESTVFRAGSVVISLNATRRSFKYPLLEIDVIGTAGRVKISDMNVDGINGRMMIQKESDKTWVEGAPLTLTDIFYRSVTEWVKALRGERELSSSGKDGLSVMQIEAAISRSNREKRSIPLPRP